MITRYAVQVLRPGTRTWDWFNNNMTAYSFPSLKQAKEFVDTWQQAQEGVRIKKGIRIVKLSILVEVIK